MLHAHVDHDHLRRPRQRPVDRRSSPVWSWPVTKALIWFTSRWVTDAGIGQPADPLVIRLYGSARLLGQGLLLAAAARRRDRRPQAGTPGRRPPKTRCPAGRPTARRAAGMGDLGRAGPSPAGVFTQRVVDDIRLAQGVQPVHIISPRSGPAPHSHTQPGLSSGQSPAGSQPVGLQESIRAAAPLEPKTPGPAAPAAAGPRRPGREGGRPSPQTLLLGTNTPGDGRAMPQSEQHWLATPRSVSCAATPGALIGRPWLIPSTLRRGWTTGACATAATKGALIRLWGGAFPDRVGPRGAGKRTPGATGR